MPKITREDLEKRQVKLTIEIPIDEQTPFLHAAAEELSEQTTIPGFRPGKAPYNVLKDKLGEMKILEAALEPMVRKAYVDAITREDLNPAGQPAFSMDKMAPGNPVVFTAEIGLMPEVLELADIEKLSVEKKDAKATEEDMAKALQQLRKMQTKEIRGTKEEAAKKEDKVVVDMDMKKDKVPIEGGAAKGYQVYLSEEHYIPGFADQIVGMKEGEQKTFTLSFPKDHYQKNLAGGEVEFSVTINELYHLDHPDLNDEFAKSIGQKDLKELKEVIEKNISSEKEMEEAMRQEREVLELMAGKSKFTDIPDLLVTQEVNKMVHELEHNVTQQGVEFDQYLKNIGKNLGELKLDFTPQALMRIRVAIVMQKVANEFDIKAEEKEIDAEIDEIAGQYEDKETKDRIYSPMYREYMQTMLRNKKTIEFLKSKIVK